ncbi:MAG: protein translocase subunit SecF [Clostridia bacterium]|nr:protein translocase subunit SecF [Clostridia bacterium]
MANLSFRDKQFKIVNKFFIFLAISLVVIIAGVVDILVRGMNIGIEFSAGASIEVTVDDFSGFDGDAFKKTFQDWLAGDRLDGEKSDRKFDVSRNTQTSSVSGKTTYEFRIGTTVVENGETVDLTAAVEDENGENSGKTLLNEYVIQIRDEILPDVRKYLSEHESYYADTEADDIDVSVDVHTIDNSVMVYTIRTTFIAGGVAILVILAYIILRFTWISGIAAILALIHDVAIMIACTTFFQIPVNSTFIAAVITIIGYSINATIVVFDRIRELERTPSYDDVSDTELANKAITNTLSRSILTTFTTLVMIVLIAIFGTSAIREFAFPIIFGLIAGAYSSILLAGSFWVYLRKLFRQSGKRNKKKVSKKAARVETATVNE